MLKCFRLLFTLFHFLLFVFVTTKAESQSSQEAPSDGFLKREFSLSKPYSGSGMNMPFWDFRDNVFLTNNFIRLTSNRQSQHGSLWNKFPCHLRDWELQVTFKIHGGGRTLAADGMAIWYTKYKMNDGSVFGSADHFDGLGVFLDTYKNGDQAVTFPQISAMIGNGTYEYDHANDGKKHTIGSCMGSFRNQDYDTLIAIRYAREKLTVNLDIDGLGTWRNCFEMDGVTLPTGYYFGVSAATGDLAGEEKGNHSYLCYTASKNDAKITLTFNLDRWNKIKCQDNHDVISIKFYQLDISRSQDELSEDRSSIIPNVKHSQMLEDIQAEVEEPSKTSGFKVFFIFLCIAIVVCLCVIGVLFVLKKRQDENRKRFY